MLKNEILRKMRWVGFLMTLFVLLVFVKIYFSSMNEFKKAEAALSKGNYREAINHYERAILWYLPVGGYVELSAERLWRLGELLEEKDRKMALEVYRSLRSGFYATRSFYTPGQAWIEQCDQKIALLMAQETPYSEADKKKSPDQRAEETLAILKRPMKPDPGGSIVLEIGFWGWVAGTLLFITRAFNPENKIIPKWALFLGGIIILFYALWMIGMVHA